MKMEWITRNPDTLRLTLTGDEIRYLRRALQRATFLDTPPQEQREIYNFSDDLLREMEKVTGV